MSYYSKTVKKNSYYGGSPTSSNRRTEPDMRTEFINTLDGSYPEIEKGHWGLLRKATLDDDGKPVACPCVDETTKEPDRNSFCPVCFGLGYYWEESYISMYRTIEVSDQTNAFLNTMLPAGKVNIPSNAFYIRYSDEINTYDQLIEITLDEEGEVSYPITRTEIYSINFAWPYRLDYGRIEYWKVFGNRLHTKFLNPPSYGD